MTTREDIKAFIVADLPSRLSAAITVAVTDSYSGQLRRINEADFEVRVKYLNNARVRRDTGLTTHALQIEVLSSGWDESEEDNLAGTIEATSDLLVDSYDGKINLFSTNLTSVQVKDVRCARLDPLVLDQYLYRRATASIELDELES